MVVDRIQNEGEASAREFSRSMCATDWAQEQDLIYDTEDIELLTATVICMAHGLELEDQIKIMGQRPQPEHADVYYADWRNYQAYKDKEREWKLMVTSSDKILPVLHDTYHLEKSYPTPKIPGWKSLREQ